MLNTQHEFINRNITTELSDLQELLFTTISDIASISKEATRRIKYNKLRTTRKNELLLSSISDAVLITDLNGIISECNKSAYNMLGCTHNELVGRNINDIIIDENYVKKCNNKKFQAKVAVHEVDNEKLYIIKLL